MQYVAIHYCYNSSLNNENIVYKILKKCNKVDATDILVETIISENWMYCLAKQKVNEANLSNEYPPVVALF